MRLWIGTSGYSYAEWKGSFYPSDLAATKMLSYYAERFPTVEINATFYRMPTDKLLAGWMKQAPEHFRFTLKAPRYISYSKRVEESADAIKFFLGRGEKLGKNRAALLFQLPPLVKKDVGLLKDFLVHLPRDARVTFELREPSWHSDDVYTALADAGAALCISDSEKLTMPIVATTTWGYFRLRDQGYERADLEKWHAQITSQKWEEAYVYFKHEDAGKGAQFGGWLQEIDGRNGKKSAG